MERMTGQTKIIVATACCLALVDIAVRTMTGSGAPCSTCVGMDNHGVLTAQAVRLVDNHGNMRGLWNTDENGEPALWMYDRNGATRIELDTTENIPSLSLHDTDGNRRVYFGMNKNDGSGLFAMMEPDAKTARFVLDGSDLTPHYKMSDDGSFTETLETGTAYDGLQWAGRHIIFAPGVHPVGGQTVEDGVTIVPQTTR